MVNGSYLNRKEDKLPLPARLFLLALTFLWLTAVSRSGVVVAQAGSGITAPASGETLAGVVEVRGTAVHPNYLRYELAFANQFSGSDWIVFAEGSEPVTDGVLAVWDTTVGQAVGAPVFPDGRYQLRLRVVKTDFNYDEFFVNDLIIQNDGPTPTPTPDETAVGLTATAVVPAPPTGSEDSSFQQPTPLPSLTPFPTLTPPPTVVSGTPSAPQAVGDETDGGLLGQLEAVQTDQVGSAFWLGIRLAIGLFLVAGGYLLLRWVGRRLWHIYWTQRGSGR